MALKFIIKPKKVSQAGECRIYCQYINHDNSSEKNYSSTLFSTDKRIEPKYWDKVQGKAIKGASANAINKSLDNFKANIYELISVIEKEKQFPTTKRLKEAFENDKEENQIEVGITKSLINQWESYITRKESEGLAPNTIKSYRNAKDGFKTFLGSKAYISPSGLSFAMVDDYKGYLSKKYKPNTVAKYTKRLKEFLKSYLIRGGELSFNIDKITFKEKPKPKVYLTQNELDALYQIDLKGKRELHRDVFFLMCHTGFRISDLKNLDKNIIGNKIKLRTQKNDKDVVIPITIQMDTILKKYDYKIPYISEGVSNRDIKKLCEKAIPTSTIQVRDEKNKLIQVPKHKIITNHDAVRTFVMMCHEKGISIKDISVLVGKTIAVLEKYYIPQATDVAVKAFTNAFDVAPMKIAQ
jgi:integrase